MLEANQSAAKIAFLQKPFDPEQLLIEVRGLIPTTRHAAA
jgi:hypothetical protein